MEKAKWRKTPEPEVADGILAHEEWAVTFVIQFYFHDIFKKVMSLMERNGFGYDRHSAESVAWKVMNDIADALEKGFASFYEQFRLIDD